MWKLKSKNDLSIVISGSAGQGLQALEQLLMRIMNSAGYHVFAYSEFMSRIRGGNNSTEVRISSERVNSFVDRIDIFFPIEAGSMSRLGKRISGDTLIIGPEKFIEDKYKQKNRHIIYLDEDKSGGEDGKILMNIFVFGLLSALMGIKSETAAGLVREYFSKSTDQQLKDNLRSIEKGYAFFQSGPASGIAIPLFQPAAGKDKESILYGSDAITAGALAGGCNFLSSYPMSPSTNVLHYMAKRAEEFGIVVEQTEDEISAINMALGAWYAGARAMVTTAGGGFALMIEALSLAGAIESPMVIHLGQRPGPATGLPTRTEQADLLMALYAGHGEFPRVILAPGTKAGGIDLGCRAFNIADKYQVPVFILTDQYYLDSAYNAPAVDMDQYKVEKYIVETAPDYKRHAFTKDGISPRGIPGFGSGIVCVDSDEHDEGGYITEDFKMRTMMVDKRLRKLKALEKDVIKPNLTGSKNYKILLVCWGSTFWTVSEAMKIIDNNDIAMLHFSQVYPLHKKTDLLLKQAKKTIIIENNATSQFGKLIKSETGHVFDHAVLKYDGMPFSVEEIAENVSRYLQSKPKSAKSIKKGKGTGSLKKK